MGELQNKDKNLVTEIIKQQNAREHLANERTLLAWIRTSIGIMAFGFVVVKFSLFIKQISLLLGNTAKLPPQNGYSSMIGILLVAVGAVVLLLAYIKFKQTEKQLNNEAFEASSKLVFSITIIILSISILLILYLIDNTNRY
ncbi:YidH family protein [Flavobacterium sp. Arc2]|uniref:YidH family protein n=1 Tax=Flavobacterium sp. Arc2 TaxID=3046685 RepID=UPI00352C10AC